MLSIISVVFLYETGPIQWMFNQHWGYWWPGALAAVLTTHSCVSRCLRVKWWLIGEAGWHCWQYTARERSEVAEETGRLVLHLNLNSKLHHTDVLTTLWQLVHNSQSPRAAEMIDFISRSHLSTHYTSNIFILTLICVCDPLVHVLHPYLTMQHDSHVRLYSACACKWKHWLTLCLFCVNSYILNLQELRTEQLLIISPQNFVLINKTPFLCHIEITAESVWQYSR